MGGWVFCSISCMDCTRLRPAHAVGQRHQAVHQLLVEFIPASALEDKDDDAGDPETQGQSDGEGGDDADARNAGVLGDQC